MGEGRLAERQSGKHQMRNGPGFISKKLQEWSNGNDISLLYAQPECPTQNGYIEWFNGSYRRM